MQEIARKLASPVNSVRNRAIRSLELKMRINSDLELDPIIVGELLEILKSREFKQHDDFIVKLLEMVVKKGGIDIVCDFGGFKILSALESENMDSRLKTTIAGLRNSLTSRLQVDSFVQNVGSAISHEITTNMPNDGRIPTIYPKIKLNKIQQDAVNSFSHSLPSLTLDEAREKLKWICDRVGPGIFLERKQFDSFMLLLKAGNYDVGLFLVQELVNCWANRIDELTSNCEWDSINYVDKNDVDVCIFDGSREILVNLMTTIPSLDSRGINTVVLIFKQLLPFMKLEIEELYYSGCNQELLGSKILEHFMIIMSSGDQNDAIWNLIKKNLAFDYILSMDSKILDNVSFLPILMEYIATNSDYDGLFTKLLWTLAKLEYEIAFPVLKQLLYLVQDYQRLELLIQAINSWRQQMKILDKSLIGFCGPIFNILYANESVIFVEFRHLIIKNLVIQNSPRDLVHYLPFLQSIQNVVPELFEAAIEKCEHKFKTIVAESKIRSLLSRDKLQREKAAEYFLDHDEERKNAISNVFISAKGALDSSPLYIGYCDWGDKKFQELAMQMASSIDDFEGLNDLYSFLFHSIVQGMVVKEIPFISVMTERLLLTFTMLHGQNNVPISLLQSLFLLCKNSRHNRQLLNNGPDFKIKLLNGDCN